MGLLRNRVRGNVGLRKSKRRERVGFWRFRRRGRVGLQRGRPRGNVILWRSRCKWAWRVSSRRRGNADFLKVRGRKSKQVCTSEDLRRSRKSYNVALREVGDES